MKKLDFTEHDPDYYKSDLFPQLLRDIKLSSDLNVLQNLYVLFTDFESNMIENVFIDEVLIALENKITFLKNNLKSI